MIKIVEKSFKWRWTFWSLGPCNRNRTITCLGFLFLVLSNNSINVFVFFSQIVLNKNVDLVTVNVILKSKMLVLFSCRSDNTS